MNSQSSFFNRKVTSVYVWLIFMGIFAFGSSLAVAQVKSMVDKQTKIRNAMSAAPEAISANATIMDWPKTEGEQAVVLKKGSNGWICYPDLPQTEGNDPMCLDDQWVAFFDAYMKHESPKITRVGISYMLGEGAFGSNTDPWATKETPDNEWAQDGPHIMVVVPDAASLAGMNTDRTKGEPYVMFRNTPYAHIMIPLPMKMKMSAVH